MHHHDERATAHNLRPLSAPLRVRQACHSASAIVTLTEIDQACSEVSAAVLVALTVSGLLRALTGFVGLSPNQIILGPGGVPGKSC